MLQQDKLYDKYVLGGINIKRHENPSATIYLRIGTLAIAWKFLIWSSIGHLSCEENLVHTETKTPKHQEQTESHVKIVNADAGMIIVWSKVSYCHLSSLNRTRGFLHPFLASCQFGPIHSSVDRMGFLLGFQRCTKMMRNSARLVDHFRVRSPLHLRASL